LAGADREDRRLRLSSCPKGIHDAVEIEAREEFLRRQNDKTA